MILAFSQKLQPQSRRILYHVKINSVRTGRGLFVCLFVCMYVPTSSFVYEHHWSLNIKTNWVVRDSGMEHFSFHTKLVFTIFTGS